MHRIPKTKEEFDKMKFLEQSRIKKDLVQRHFPDFCSNLTTASIQSFASVLHDSDLNELQKRARYESETVVMSELLLKLFRSGSGLLPWWEVLENVLAEGKDDLYKFLNPWEDQDDRHAAARGQQPPPPPPPPPSSQPPPPSQPSAPPLSKLTSRGGGPQAPYPACTPLGNTWGLADLLQPLCVGQSQRWRRLADLLGLVTKKQIEIKSSGGDIHIHLFDTVVEVLDDGATVGALTDALLQLGPDGQNIVSQMEEQKLIQPIPREGSEAGEGAVPPMDNPYNSEREGGTSTVTSQPPSGFPLPRVSSSERNSPPLGPVQEAPDSSQTSLSSTGATAGSLPPPGLDSNFSSAHQVKELAKDLKAAISQALGPDNFQVHIPEPASSSSSTENDHSAVTSPGGAGCLPNNVNNVSRPAADRTDAVSDSIECQMNIPPQNTRTEDNAGNASLHMDSSLSLEDQHQADNPPRYADGSSEESSPPTSLSPPDNGGQDGSGIRNRNAEMLPQVTYNITISGRTSAVNVGGTNTSTVKRTFLQTVMDTRGAGTEAPNTPQDEAGDVSDDDTIAEFDAHGSESSLSDVRQQYQCHPPPNMQHHFSGYTPGNQGQNAEGQNVFGPSAQAGPFIGEEDFRSYQPPVGSPAHQTSRKQLWNPQEQESGSPLDSLVEEGPGTSVDSFPFPPPQECQEDLYRQADGMPMYRDDTFGSVSSSQHSGGDDVDLREVPLDRLNLRQTESLSGTTSRMSPSQNMETSLSPGQVQGGDRGAQQDGEPQGEEREEEEEEGQRQEGEREEEEGEQGEHQDLQHDLEQQQDQQQLPARANFLTRFFKAVKDAYVGME